MGPGIIHLSAFDLVLATVVAVAGASVVVVAVAVAFVQSFFFLADLGVDDAGRVAQRGASVGFLLFLDALGVEEPEVRDDHLVG